MTKKEIIFSKAEEWYKPHNYSVVDSFSGLQFSESLWARYLLNLWIQREHELSVETCELYRQLISGDISGMAGDGEESTMTDCPSVMPLDCEDIFPMAEVLRAENWKPDTHAEPWTCDSYDLLKNERRPVKSDDAMCFINLSIDLAASDENIIKELKDFLPAFRKALNYPSVNPNTKTGKDSGWSSWISRAKKNKVLNILDVLIWGAVNKFDVGPALISRLIFSDTASGGTPDDVRKTYLPQARLAIQKRRITAMQYDHWR